VPKASGEFPLHSRTVAPYSPIKIPLLEEGDYYLVRFYREDGYAVGTTFSSEDAEKKVLTVPAPALPGRYRVFLLVLETEATPGLSAFPARKVLEAQKLLTVK